MRRVSACNYEVGKNPEKVISFSLFFRIENSHYYFIEGIEDNLEIIKRLYPDWIVRIYTRIPVNDVSCYFICKYKFLHWCNVEYLPIHGK